MPSAAPIVLIVDDHVESLAMYAFGLLAMGFQPVTAGSADEAFSRACDIHPDAVVADFTTRPLSGLALTRRLRDDSRTRDAGIIVLTGGDEDYAGDRVLLKPCLPDALAFEIHDLLASPRQRSRERGDGAGGSLTEDGDSKPCPRCGKTLVFSSRHPILTVAISSAPTGTALGGCTRDEPSWVCRNQRCDYREPVAEQ